MHVLDQTPGALALAASIERCQSASQLSALELCFHGTVEPIRGALQVGGDGLFWTASSPAVAQAYIPASGSSIFISTSRWGRSERIRPDVDPVVLDWALSRSGATLAELDVQAECGRSTSWRVPANWPRWGDLEDFLEDLGYDVRRGSCWVKLGPDSAMMPADWRLPGRLYILRPPRLRLAPVGPQEGDLQDPSHLRLDKFEAARRAGYDGVLISDFLQSPEYGNVGHPAVGLFQSALNRCEYLAIPARHHAFVSTTDLASPLTEEITALLGGSQAELELTP